MKTLLNSPFSELKIDKSFVAQILTSRDAHMIVKSIAHLAQDLGLKTVAEGVEAPDIVDQLLEFGVDSIQGYHVSRPMPPEALAQWLARQSSARSLPTEAATHRVSPVERRKPMSAASEAWRASLLH